MKVQVDEVPAHRDARGMVFEPLGGDELGGHQNVHVVLTEPGQVRGNHYHRLGTEVLVVVGPALVRVREEGQPRDYDVPAGAVHRFLMPPGIPHAIQNTGPDPCVMVGFNSVAHDPAQSDTFRDVLIEV